MFAFKVFKKRNEKPKKEYQDYKKLFESIKKRSKKLHFSKLLLKYKNNIKKTWQVIKEAIGKEKYKQQNFPKKILVDKISITETESTAESFNILLKLVQNWPKILVHQLKVLMSTLRNITLPSQKK